MLQHSINVVVMQPFLWEIRYGLYSVSHFAQIQNEKITAWMYHNNNDRLTAFDPGQPG